MPKEESQLERDVNAILEKARGALTAGESMARVVPKIESAVSYVIEAVERVVSTQHGEIIPRWRFAEEGAWANPPGMQDPVAGYEDVLSNTFSISFPTVKLAVSEIWPDGDHPENPTVDDVLEKMRKGGSGPGDLAAGWLLIDNLYVSQGTTKKGFYLRDQVPDA